MGQHVISADVGGTNSRLQLYAGVPPVDGFALLAEAVFPSSDFASLTALVVRFLDKVGFDGVVDAACIAVCGPVENEDRMCGPVLPEQPPTQWNACAADLMAGPLKGRVRKAVLINDFVAVGFGLTALPPKDAEMLHPAAVKPRAPIACIGAGTGLGEVFLTWEASKGRYTAWPSEGGMTPYSPLTEREWDLRQWCVARDGYATVESVVSGPGLRNTFQYLVSTGMADTITAGVAPEGLPRAIAEAGLAKTDPVASEALEVVMRAWASECRQVSLRVMPYGGLYLAGGLAPKLLPAIKEFLVPEFLEGDKLMASVHTEIPLLAVTNESVGLLGAKVRAVMLLDE
mmetsp:Transcript_21229/g.55393  ORF Transcript_21229/g.55393 Transcript_21229/m.55393 type:complete len:344 (+) Transcript_21229:105-1136(+)